MSKIQMSNVSVRIIRHLAEVGPRTIEELVAKFSAQHPTTLRKRLSSLEHGWWLQRQHRETTATLSEVVWRVHPDAYAKLPGIGLVIPPSPPTKRGVGRPRDVYVPRETAQPRRDNVWAAPVWQGWGQAAVPARAGSMDFMACPSRGAI